MPLSTVERVKRVTVCVVVPWRTSTTLTRILAGLDADDGVAVGVTRTGDVPVALGVAVAPGVLVALAVPVAVGVVAVEVEGPFVGSDVSGSLLSKDRTALGVGGAPGNFVTVKTVTALGFAPGLGVRFKLSMLIAIAGLPGWSYFACKSFLMVSCTLLSTCVFKRIQMVWLPATWGLSPVTTCRSTNLKGCTRFFV